LLSPYESADARLVFTIDPASTLAQHKAAWLGSTVGRYPMSNGLCLMSQGCSPAAQDRQEPRRRTPYMAALYNLYRYIVLFCDDFAQVKLSIV
jgi:hypothetical protein